MEISSNDRQTIQLRRANSKVQSEAIANSRIILKKGEPFFCIINDEGVDRFRLYVGDGVTQLKNLPYVNKLTASEIVNIIGDTPVANSEDALNVSATINKVALSDIFTEDNKKVKEARHADEATHAEEADVATKAKQDINGANILDKYISDVASENSKGHKITNYYSGNHDIAISLTDINHSVFLLRPSGSWSGGKSKSITIPDEGSIVDITSSDDYKYITVGDILIQVNYYYVYTVNSTSISSSGDLTLGLSYIGQIKGEKGDKGAQGVRGLNMYAYDEKEFTAMSAEEQAEYVGCTWKNSKSHMKGDVCVITSPENGPLPSESMYPLRGTIMTCKYATAASASTQVAYWAEQGNVVGYTGQRGEQGYTGQTGPSGHNQWLLKYPDACGINPYIDGEKVIDIDNTGSPDAVSIFGSPDVTLVNAGDTLTDNTNFSIWTVSEVMKISGEESLKKYKLKIQSTKKFSRGSQTLYISGNDVSVETPYYRILKSKFQSEFPYFLNTNDVIIVSDSANDQFKNGTTFRYNTDFSGGSNKTTYYYFEKVESFQHLIINNMWEDLWSKVYPVGSIYWNSTVGTNPNELFGGGTWAQVHDRFVLPQGSAFPINKDGKKNTGGSTEIKIGVENLPAHSHTMTPSGAHKHNIWSDYDGATGTTTWTVYNNAVPPGRGHALNDHAITSAGGHTHTIGNTGAGKALSHMPPYQTAYCWVRTA